MTIATSQGCSTSMPRRIWWRLTLASLIAGAVAGCAAPSAIHESSTLNANQGVVTLRVVSLHERTLRHLTIQNVDTQEDLKLEPQPALGGDSYRFTGIVPAGRYRTKHLHGSDVEDLGYAQRTHTLTVPLDRPANRFEVLSGHLTNLGSLIFTPIQGSKFVAPREETPVAARDWLEYANPKLAASLNPSRELGWAEPVSAADREQTQRMIWYAQSKTVPTSPPAVDAQGHAWAGGRLGLVAQMRGTDATQRYQTDSVHQILSVAHLADGRLLAAGEEGYVAVSSADRKSWRAVPAPVSRASAGVFVTQAADRTVYLVSRTPRGVVVFAADPAHLAWKEVHRVERDTTTATANGSWVRIASFGYARPMATVTRERLVVYTPDPELMSSMDLRTKTWEAHPPSVAVVAMQSSPDGLIVVRNAWPSMFSSTDYGKSWNKIENYMLETMPVFTDRANGYLLAKPFDAWKPMSPGLFKTADGGKTWTRIGAAPPRVNWQGHLAYDGTRRRIGYQHPDGGLTWTEDEGSSWR